MTRIQCLERGGRARERVREREREEGGIKNKILINILPKQQKQLTSENSSLNLACCVIIKQYLREKEGVHFVCVRKKKDYKF